LHVNKLLLFLVAFSEKNGREVIKQINKNNNMKIFKTAQIRNITLSGNAGSGKTTLAEAMLFEGGIINRRGEVT